MTRLCGANLALNIAKFAAAPCDTAILDNARTRGAAGWARAPRKRCNPFLPFLGLMGSKCLIGWKQRIGVAFLGHDMIY